jgi:glycosyltransferase involved in cell wall biosynthesis
MTILGLYLLNHIRTGGNRKYLELLEGLAARGNKVLVLFNGALDYIPSSFTKISIPLQYSGRFPPASYLFKKYLRHNIKSIKDTILSYGKQIDFIVNFGDTQLKAAIYLKRQFATALLHGIRCSDVDRAHILRSCNYMNTKQFAWSLFYEQIDRSREKKAARLADCITFLNNSDKKSFIQRTHCSEKKISLIPNHIGPPGCTGEYKNKNSSVTVKNIVYVGVISAEKGLWDLLKAAAILKAKGLPKLHYFLLGRLENTEPTYNYINDLNIADIVSFEGYQDPFPYFAKYDLFIYPTLYDAFGNVITEALHTGCPVIASSVGGVSEILRFPELLFRLGKPEEIAEKIEACVMDNNHYRKIRELCKQRASVYYFDWPGRYESLMKNYLTEIAG